MGVGCMKSPTVASHLLDFTQPRAFLRPRIVGSLSLSLDISGGKLTLQMEREAHSSGLKLLKWGNFSLNSRESHNVK